MPNIHNPNMLIYCSRPGCMARVLEAHTYCSQACATEAAVEAAGVFADAAKDRMKTVARYAEEAGAALRDACRAVDRATDMLASPLV